MKFTDDDLKRLKEYLFDISLADPAEFLLMIENLIKRMEAAEMVIRKSGPEDLDGDAMEAWRKSKGE